MNSHRPDGSADDRLAELLELVDGPRDLPVDEEERILASILTTAAAPSDAGELVQPPSLVPLEDDRPALPLPPARTFEPRRPRWVLAAATLTAVAAAVAGLVVLRSPAGRAPTVADQSPVSSPSGGLDAVETATICDAATDLVVELRFDTRRPNHSAVDVPALERLADLLAELADRSSDGAATDLRAAAAVLRLEARNLTEDDHHAADRAWTRAAEQLTSDPPLLARAGCEG